MRIVEDWLATVDRAVAHQIGDVLILRVTGTKPTACHIVTLERSLLDVEPPAFIARMTMDPAARCAQVTAPFEEVAAFRVGTLRPEVLLHHGGGEMTVEVEELHPSSTLARPSGGAAGTGIFDVEREPVDAVGRSRSYDFAEALREAVDQLPAQHPEIPDWLSTYTVVSIGVHRGGIGGFDHLVVHVRG